MTPATPKAAPIGTAKMTGEPRTPENTSVRTDVGSKVAAETSTDDNSVLVMYCLFNGVVAVVRHGTVTVVFGIGVNACPPIRVTSTITATRVTDIEIFRGRDIIEDVITLASC